MACRPACLPRSCATCCGRLQFDGVTVTDALDMHALAQGSAQIVDAIAALRAGEDVLLGTADEAALERLEEGLAQAQRRGLIDADDDAAAIRRLGELRRWLGGFDQPPLDVVGCGDHQALAAELARRSITLVRDDERLLPLKPAADARIAVVQSMPANLTPADTSSTVTPTLAAALRRRLPGVEEILLPAAPGTADIAGLGHGLATFDLVLVGTFSAHLQPAQATLAEAVLATGKPTVTVALRTPWDLLAYPSARTHICSYGILPPSMEALAAALLGESPFVGRLPVDIAGLYPAVTGSCDRAKRLRPGDESLEPARTVLRGAALAGEIDVDEAEPPGVAIAPLIVVEQRPDVVAGQWYSCAKRVSGRGDVACEVGLPALIAHPAALLDGIRVRGAVLADHDLAGSIRPVEFEQHVAQTVGRHVPSHLCLLEARPAPTSQSNARSDLALTESRR